MSKRYFVKTDSVVKSLKDHSKNLKVPLNDLDFEIVEIYTKYKDEQNPEWVEVHDEELEKLKDPEFLSNASLEIVQSYDIEVFKKEPKKRPQVKIGANKDKTKVVFILPSKTKYKYSQKLQEYIETTIKKQMALYGYLLDIWDLQKPLQEFFDVLEESEKIKYGQRQFIPIAQSPLPKIEPIHDSLALLYEGDTRVKSDYDRVDHSKRGFAYGIKKDDVIIQYIRAKEGRVGRDCKGKFLPVEEPKESNTPNFSISENIEIVEKDESIDYVAKKNGYVTFANNSYDIEQYLEVDVIDFKTTGDVDLGVDSDVRLVVNGTNDMADSIGQGMEVNAKEINIMQGTIGSGVVIHAQKVNVASITHQNSKIFADDITINVHNGFAKGKTVHVKRLEGGMVEGDKVFVEQAVGGEIRGGEVYIDLLTSNSMICASKVIEVTTLKGEDNDFLIDPSLIEGLRDEIDVIEDEIDKFEDARTNIYKELKQKRAGLRQNESILKKIKEQILEDREKGVKTPVAYIQKVKKLQSVIKSVRILDEEIMLIDDELNRLRGMIAVKQSIVLDAKIINKSSWSGYNKVSFALISPEIVEETTTEGKKNIIMLIEGGDGEYKIESQEIIDLDQE